MQQGPVGEDELGGNGERLDARTWRNRISRLLDPLDLHGRQSRHLEEFLEARLESLLKVLQTGLLCWLDSDHELACSGSSSVDKLDRRERLRDGGDVDSHFSFDVGVEAALVNFQADLSPHVRKCRQQDVLYWEYGR